MANPAAALRLPDPLLVRYYRDGKIDNVQKVEIETKTRNVSVTLRGGGIEKWKYLVDIGWIPEGA